MTNETTKFNEILMQYYADYGRYDLPWRQPEPDGRFDPYKIMVSELMLQQTQVARVIPKFNEFLINFPDVDHLATAPLSEVLLAWSGLGYNRRAKFLWQAAQSITGHFPQTSEDLVKLPGIGKNTAGAILAYAYNQPVLFLETNVRTVYIHHFFQDQIEVPDAEIVKTLAATLDQTNPREFYWALMDYGTYLKKTVGNLSRYAKGYAKQSKFEGSRRQIRGQVLKFLATQSLTLPELADRIPDERLAAVVSDLLAEKLITRIDDQRLAL